jgi:hypothetical protein
LWELKNGIVWVEIPKNASYNLKQFKFNYDSKFPIENQPNSFLNKIKKIDMVSHKRAFVVIRNPIDRFKSLLSHYFIDGSRSDLGKLWLKNMGVIETTPNRIVSDVLARWDSIGSISEPHHFNSQLSFIPKEFFLMNHMIYDISEVGFMFGLQKGVNSSKSVDIFIDDNNKNKIKELYIEDVKLYEKYFNLNL